MDTQDYYIRITYKSLIISGNEMNYFRYKITLWVGVIFNTMNIEVYMESLI